MTFGELYEYVLDKIPEAKSRKMVARAANEVIREVNAKTDAYIQTVNPITVSEIITSQSLVFADDNPDTITGTGFNATDFADGMYVHAPSADTNTGTYLTAAHSDSIITLDAVESLSAETVTTTLECYTVLSGFSFDGATNVLTLAPTVQKVLDFWDNDDNKLTNKDLVRVNDSDYSADYIYTQLAYNKLQFPTGILDGDGDYLKMQYRLQLPEIDDYGNSVDLSIPDGYKNTVLYGTYMHLFSHRQFFNENMIQFWNTKYLSALGDATHNDRSRIPRQRIDPDFSY